eukprot:COSAG03_NODE_1348_length_4281_cov_116.671927_4_plen_309_part_00
MEAGSGRGGVSPQDWLCEELGAALSSLLDPSLTSRVLELFRYTYTQRHECKTRERSLRLFVTELRQPRLGLDARTLQAVEDSVFQLLASAYWRQGWCETTRRGSKPRWCVLFGPHHAPFLAHCADPDAHAPDWSYVPNLQQAGLTTADDYGRLAITLSAPGGGAALLLVPSEDGSGWLADLQRACGVSRPGQGEDATRALRKSVTDLVRGKVSKKKERYKKGGFDLDLTYVTDNLIAMGFPSEGAEALYRNPMAEVQHFLNSRHPGCYRVYNLCSERAYPSRAFENRVGRQARSTLGTHSLAPVISTW